MLILITFDLTQTNLTWQPNISSLIDGQSVFFQWIENKTINKNQSTRYFFKICTCASYFLPASWIDVVHTRERERGVKACWNGGVGDVDVDDDGVMATTCIQRQLWRVISDTIKCVLEYLRMVSTWIWLVRRSPTLSHSKCWSCLRWPPIGTATKTEFEYLNNFQASAFLWWIRSKL